MSKPTTKEMREQIEQLTNAVQGYETQLARQQVQIRMLQEFANSIIQRGNQLQLDVENLNRALQENEKEE
jgi:regulator of replication initiation timing|tara:strand:- start:89 stop:298 length:210 start_codon:yes stop_codon:yes gene_type:complete